MSQQLTVDLTEHEMSQIMAAARAKHLDPRQMTAQQLLELLGTVNCAVTSGSDGAKRPAPNVSTASGQTRAKRLEAAMSVNGMWKGQSDKPQDGLEYQREVRAEWQ